MQIRDEDVIVVRGSTLTSVINPIRYIGGWDSSQPKSSVNHPLLEKAQQMFNAEEGSALDAFNKAAKRFPDLFAEWEQIKRWEELGYLANPRVQSVSARLLVLETRIAALQALAEIDARSGK